MKEWKIVKGSSMYEISKDGSLRSNFYSHPRIIGTSKPNGYHIALLIGDDGIKRMKRVARLVAIAFIGDPPSKDHIVNHKDGVKDNDNVDNLEWATQSEDKQHAHDIGLNLGYDKSGSNNPSAKLNESDVLEIKELLALGYVHHDIAELFSVSRHTITDINRGKSWAHLERSMK
jgi:hypothetical protein